MTENFTVNWEALPETRHWEDLRGDRRKFIQVNVVGKRYLRFAGETELEIVGDSDCMRHSHILSNLLKELGVSYHTIRADDGYEIPAREGEGYNVYGAGYAKIRGIVAGKPRVEFGEQSRDYQVGFDKSDLPSLRSQKPDWEIM